MVDNPLKVLWIGLCTISEYKEVTDTETYQTSHTLVPVVVDEPCRLSYKRETTSNVVNGAAEVVQSIVLIIRPDLEIKEGSVIEVTQRHRTTKYKRSSKPAIYTNHQEVVLELYEENV